MVEFDKNGMVIAQTINKKIKHGINHDRLYEIPLINPKKESIKRVLKNDGNWKRIFNRFCFWLPART